jgi:hypothetical protein
MDYFQGYEDAMRQARVTRNTGLLSFLFRIIISFLYNAFIYVPLLALSYLLVNKMSFLYNNDIIIKSGLTVIICYLLFAFICFLKGILIGLRNTSRLTWILVWFCCVAVTCGIQVLLTQWQLESWFSSRGVNNHYIWSWLGGLAVGAIIYSHYRFLSNIAPRSVFWSYAMGCGLIKSSKVSMTPNRSPAFFDNTPMKVSFKRADQ